MIAADAPILFCKACESASFVRVLTVGPYRTRALPRVLVVPCTGTQSPFPHLTIPPFVIL